MKPIFLIIARYFPTPNSWRCAYGYDYAKAIQKDGRYDVRVVVVGAAGDYEYGGVPVYALREARTYRWWVPHFTFYWLNQIRFQRALARVGIKNSDIAIVDAYNVDLGYYGWSIRKRNPKVLLLQHHHDLQPASWGEYPWLYRVVNFLWLHLLYGSQDIHVFLSDLSRKSLERYPDTEWVPEDVYYKKSSRGLHWMRPIRVNDSYILYNGVNRNVFKPLDLPSKGDGFRIGVVANFLKLKGIDTLLESVMLLRDKIKGLHVDIIGSGPEAAALHHSVAANGQEEIVSFLPEVQHEELPRFFNSLDLYVMPSYFEGFGCVYTEAWSCGVPFIASKDGNGIVEILDDKDKDKWLVAKGDAQDLARKILRYYEMRDRQKLKEEIDIDKLVPKFLNYLDRKKMEMARV